MERTNLSFDFSTLQHTLFMLSENHDSSDLARVRDELNSLFVKSSCKRVLYTENTDNLFFGIKVYPCIDGNDAIALLGDREPDIFKSYEVEFDSKLFDTMMDLTGPELSAITIYAVYHSVYDLEVIDNIKSTIDQYYATSGEYINIKSSQGFKELLAYAIKDAFCKAGSVFTKRNGVEVAADSFIAQFNYSPDMMTALRKIVTSISFMAKEVDDTYIALAWVLRVGAEYETMRIPAYKTLVKAISFTGSVLEKNNLEYAAKIIGNTDEMPLTEGFLSGLRDRITAAGMKFKRNGVRGIKADVFELRLRLRTAEEYTDLMSIIRACNSKIAILQDYLTEEIPDEEREDVMLTLQDLYDIRQQASKDKEVQSRYSGYIKVVYPT